MGVTLFSACSDDKDEPKQPKQQTTYTIKSNSSAHQIAQDYGLTAKVDYVIYEYNDSNELINFQDWKGIKDGASSKTFVAHTRATKLVIRMDVRYSDGNKELNESMFVATIFYLNIDGNVVIDIDGETVRVSKYNPI